METRSWEPFPNCISSFFVKNWKRRRGARGGGYVLVKEGSVKMIVFHALF